MTDQRKNEIIRALARGESPEQAARADGVPEAQARQIAADCAREIQAEREMPKKAGYLP